MEYFRKECDKCSYVDFIGPGNMQSHEWQYHTTPDEIKHRNFCPVCEIVFNRRVDYDNHMECHEDESFDPEVFNIDNYRERCPTSYEPLDKGDLCPEDILMNHVRIFEETIKKMQSTQQNSLKGFLNTRRKRNHPEDKHTVSLVDTKFNIVQADIANSKNQSVVPVPLSKNGKVAVKVERSGSGVASLPSQCKNVKMELAVMENVVSTPIEGGVKKQYVSAASTSTIVKSEMKCERSETRERQSRNRNANKTLHRCPQCSYSSTDQGNFKRHTLTHTKKEGIVKAEGKVERPRGHMTLRSANTTVYQCKYCDYATKEQGNFKRHETVHLNKNNSEAFKKERQRKEKEKIKCPFTGCSFQTRETGNFSRHMSVHGVPERNKVENKCPECDFTAMGYNALNFHTLRYHLMNAPHQCEFCGDIFQTSVSLKNHRYAHAIDVGA